MLEDVCQNLIVWINQNKKVVPISIDFLDIASDEYKGIFFSYKFFGVLLKIDLFYPFYMQV